MMLMELYKAAEQALYFNNVPETSEVIAKKENGKVKFYAVIKNVQFKDGTLHTINHPLQY